MLIALIIFVVSMASIVLANGTDSDPLISKSYLDLKIKEMKTEISTLKNEISKLSSAPNGDQVGNTSLSNSGFEPLRLDPHQKIYFKKGTEFIMRVGEAGVIDPTGNGIPDLTSGRNLLNASAMPLNHLAVCPRDDGRGLNCKIEVWLLIKGDYIIE